MVENAWYTTVTENSMLLPGKSAFQKSKADQIAAIGKR